MITLDLRNKLRVRNGLPPIKKIGASLTLAEVYSQNWDHMFIQYMKNRMAMGYYRYGLLTDTSKNLDNIGSIIKRLLIYEKTGNTEVLVDIANLCMCEFINGKHPNKHFKAVDDGYHTKPKDT